MKRDFGNLLSFVVLGKRVVIINDAAITREALTGQAADNLSGRNLFEPWRQMTRGYGM